MILYKNFQLKVPTNLSAGEYSIETQVKSSLGDYLTKSSLNVNRIDSIPFSGNVPLSVLVLVFSGVITYILITYIPSGKFERSYVELGLASVGLGFVNWFIATSLYFVYFIESITNEPLGIMYLMGISVGTGLGIGLTIRAVRYCIDWMTKRSGRLRSRRERQRRGYAIDPRPTWVVRMSNEVGSVKQKLGIYYSLTVRVHLKSPYNNAQYIDGVLVEYEDKRPYDIFVGPKRTVDCFSRQSIVTYLIPLLRKELDRIQPYYNILKNQYESSSRQVISEHIRELLTQNMDTDSFFEILQQIDFSRFVTNISKDLIRQHNSNFQLDYVNITTFIPGDNIAAVEIIRYESQAALRVWGHIIPKSYEPRVFSITDKVIY